MGWQERMGGSVLAKAVGLAAMLLVLWWGGLLSSGDGKVERVYRTEARILEIYEKAWLVQLPDGRRARIIADNPRLRKVGDPVQLQVIRYSGGREEASPVSPGG